MSNPILCIYHGNCADGFGAALAVHLAKCNSEIDFYPGVYGDGPPDVSGRELVIMVDFSYKRDIILDIAKQVETVVIIDHHKTTVEDLVDLPDNVGTVFDMNKSGAVLAWEFFHPKEPIPKLLLHIQDRDLWKFELEGTREIQAAIFAVPYTFPEWEALLEADLETLRKEGEIIERKHFKDIHEFIEMAAFWMVIDEYIVPVLNCPRMWGPDAANILSKNHPFAAAFYYDNNNQVVFSLRSENGKGIDVAKFAEKFGGGGHKHAAAFRIDANDFGRIIKSPNFKL